MNEDIKLNNLIRKLIINQRDEHTPHSFRAGHAGMHDFNRLVQILRSLPVNEVWEWLDLIDRSDCAHIPCTPCVRVARMVLY